MFKKVLSAVLVSILSFLTCFAQTASKPLVSAETPAKLSRADLYKYEPAKFDFDKAAVKSQPQRNNLSSGAKTALWITLFAAGVITVVVLATRNRDNNTNTPCGSGIIAPCPPGCQCI